MESLAESARKADFTAKLYELVREGVRKAYAFRRELSGRQPVGMEFIRSGVGARRLFLIVRFPRFQAFSIEASETMRGSKVRVRYYVNGGSTPDIEDYENAPAGLPLNLLSIVENEISTILEEEGRTKRRELALPLRQHA